MCIRRGRLCIGEVLSSYHGRTRHWKPLQELKRMWSGVSLMDVDMTMELRSFLSVPKISAMSDYCHSVLFAFPVPSPQVLAWATLGLGSHPTPPAGMNVAIIKESFKVESIVDFGILLLSLMRSCFSLLLGNPILAFFSLLIFFLQSSTLSLLVEPLILVSQLASPLRTFATTATDTVGISISQIVDI